MKNDILVTINTTKSWSFY